MITLFKADESDFSHNGLGSLDKSIINPVVSEDLNGIYQFVFKYPLFEKHGLEIEGQSVIRVPTPDEEDQLFRVYRPVKTMGYLEVSCYHIFYDLIDNFIEDTNIVGKSGQGAVTQLLGATQYGHSFRAFSDIATTSNARIVRKNPIEALLDDEAENSFLSRWGGELKRNNFDIRMNKSIGSNRGKKIRHRKDLIGYEANVDWSAVTTRIMPKGFDGLLLPEKYVDSPLINKYVYPKIKMIEYQDIKAAVGEYANDEDAVPLDEAYKLLRNATKAEFNANHVDVPPANYKVDFVALDQTEVYKDFKELQKVYIGDTVTVIHEDDGINIEAKVISYEYNPLQERYLKIELGNFTDSLTKTYTDIQKVSRKLEEVSEKTLIIQATADGKASIHRGEIKPENPNVNDLWIKPNGAEVEMYQYVLENGQKYWKIIANTAELSAVKKEIQEVLEQAETDRTNAQQAINQSLSDAQTYTDQKAAAWNTTLSNQIADVQQEISTSYTQAITDAQTYTDNRLTEWDADMTTIQGEIDGMKGDISANNQLSATAVANAETSIKDSQTALTNAKNALDAYSNLTIGGRNLIVTHNAKENMRLHTDGSEVEAAGQSIMREWIEVEPGEILTFSKVQSWISEDQYFRWNWYNSASTFINRAANDSNEFHWEVPPFTQFIKVSYPNGSYAKIERGNKRTDWTPAPEDTQIQIDDINGTLSTVIHRNEFDVLEGTVGRYETRISQNETNISKMATAEYVNTIDQTVKKHTLAIEENAESISQRLTSTQVDALVTGKGYVTTNQLTETSDSMTRIITAVETDLSNLEIGGRNLILNGAFSRGLDNWGRNNNNVEVDSTTLNYPILRLTNTSSSSGYIEATQWVKVNPGSDYTLSFKNTRNASVFMVEYKSDKSATSVYRSNSMTVNGAYTSFNKTIKTMNDTGYILVILRANAGYNPFFYEVKLEKGNRATDFNPAPEDMATLTQFQQLDNQFSFYVREDGLISEINVQAGRTLISTNKLLLDANTYIMGTTFANDVKAKSLEAVYAEISEIRTQILAANVITSTQLKTDAATINKLFATTAAIDALTGNSAFIADIRATSLQAVRADIDWLRTNVLTAHSIKATHLDVGISMIDELFANSALIDRLTSKTAFINEIKAISITADKITGGTFNGANMTMINIDANAITAGTIKGANSAWNLINGLMSFTNPSTGDTVQFNQGQIQFQNGSQGRYLRYNAEGLVLDPFSTNTGTSNNTMLRLQGGGTGSYQYLQFSEGGSMNRQQRIEAVGGKVRIRVGDGRVVEMIRYENETPVNVLANGYNTYHSTGNTLYMTADRIETPRDGKARNIMISPNGTGIVQIANRDGDYYNIRASTFLNASTRKIKDDIREYQESGLDHINRLEVVDYYLKKEQALGLNIRHVGFIAEDSPYIASQDMESIDSYKLNALTVKAVQEIDHRTTEDVKRIDTFIEQYGHQLTNQEKRIEELEKYTKHLEQRIQNLEAA